MAEITNCVINIASHRNYLFSPTRIQWRIRANTSSCSEISISTIIFAYSLPTLHSNGHSSTCWIVSQATPVRFVGECLHLIYFVSSNAEPINHDASTHIRSDTRAITEKGHIIGQSSSVLYTATKLNGYETLNSHRFPSSTTLSVDFFNFFSFVPSPAESMFGSM